MVAEAYQAGAKDYEHKLRSESDKKSDDEENIKKAVEKKVAAEAASSTSGPAVVKVTKTRKLVAAGMADQVEIEQELEAESDKKDKDGENTESTDGSDA